ncbi:MAG: putative Ig domain-containing protein, partial [Planctomycetia bacterium]|nr:putative Ig domain-containing protein [Planctomycetia bacterium]
MRLSMKTKRRISNRRIDFGRYDIEIPRLHRKFTIVPLENRQLLSVCSFGNIYGVSTTQTASVAVRSVILAPTVELLPLPTGYVGEQMSYQIKATDPQGEKLTYTLVEAPVGTLLDVNTGLLQYTPDTANVIVQFKVQISNESGVSTSPVVFPMWIAPSFVPTDPGQPAWNNPPVLSIPDSSFVESGKLYSAFLTAADEDNDTLTFTLLSGPNGMTLNPVTGQILWTPDSSLIGQQFQIEVAVTDGTDESTGYFYLKVTAPNVAPVINPIPTQNITAGSSFMYRVSANDINRDPLTYSLDADSLARGMTIDANGIITWIPGIDQITDEPFEVIVGVSDGKVDEPVTTVFNVNVVPDTIAPVVDLTASKYRAQTGETIT